MTVLNLLVAVLLLIGNAFFVGAEFAAVSVRRAQVEPLADAGNKRAVRVLDALRRLSLLLAGAQLGITLCSLGLGAVAEPAVAVLFEDVFHALHVPAGLTHPIAFAIALALVVLLHMVLGEMVPKNIALASSERAALILVPALDSFVRATRVVIGSLNALANGSLRLLGIQPQDELKSAYTPEELADILAESRSEGYLDAGQHQRLTSALSFGDRTAGDVVVPAAELVTVDPDTTADAVQRLAAETGFSRFPIRRGDRLVGFVHVKDALVGDLVSDVAMPARFRHAMPAVDVAMPLPDVLTTLRRARSHLGHVVENGRSVGVVALEDVVEEVVGEIADTTHTA
ncbi:Hemolysin, contains CBS domains [Jatrophihabitans endophyticus]|uniref:Hemolysin, contains CBS domains n=1 Tax=Jatrophihabitans endophyticus TaxID=1206085 RepID=A0A1M5T5Y8_9ACTN|nr:hemolysin family protein [Jatrophihabitans endophyticus]SHH46116.1 Hemolysin, contains CBS domains [Jatrophihabitans endophyticus]